MYWIDYPLPFLRFYYDTFPAVDDILAGSAEVASLACAGGNGFNDGASDGFASSVIADPNLLQSHLLMIVMVGFNKNAFKPQIGVIKDKYYEMFRNTTTS